jgi:hypothetical protein
VTSSLRLVYRPMLQGLTYAVEETLLNPFIASLQNSTQACVQNVIDSWRKHFKFAWHLTFWYNKIFILLTYILPLPEDVFFLILPLESSNRKCRLDLIGVGSVGENVPSTLTSTVDWSETRTAATT